MIKDKATTQIDHCPGAHWIKAKRHAGGLFFGLGAQGGKNGGAFAQRPMTGWSPCRKTSLAIIPAWSRMCLPVRIICSGWTAKWNVPTRLRAGSRRACIKASRITDWHFDWTDGTWNGLPLRDYIVYELHVGTFSPEGTFDGVIARLPELKELGVTAIEIMPVAQFPGSRNWGYDGVYPFAVQESYGGPAGLKRLVNAAHAARFGRRAGRGL